MVGRNDLCPCGSGKKYKKCCLAKDEAREIAKNRVINGRKKFEGVIQKVIEFSNREEYKNYKDKFEIEFGINNYSLEHIMNNIYYLTNYEYSKQTSIMMDYFNRHKNILNEDELSIIQNTLNSYISIYQVKEKDINKILIRDILLDQNVYVEDIELFNDFDVGNYILARIVSVDTTKIFLGKTIRIDESIKDKIKEEIYNRYEKTKNKVKTKKQCLIDNIKFMYENIVDIYKEEEQEIACDIAIDKEKQEIEEPIDKEIDKKITDILKKPIVKQFEQKIIAKKAEEDIKVNQDIKNDKKEITKETIMDVLDNNKSIETENIKEFGQNVYQKNNIENKQDSHLKENKKKKQVMARKARASNKNKDVKERISKRLEDKLKQRLKVTKQIQAMEEKKSSNKNNDTNSINSKLSNKIENIPTYKAEQIESKIKNISVSKIEQIESKIENNVVAKIGTDQINKENCKVYEILVSKVENEYKEKCILAWQKFKSTYDYKGSENGWAAAIEYYVKKSIDETVTQKQISKKYDTSISTLKKRYKELLIC